MRMLSPKIHPAIIIGGMALLGIWVGFYNGFPTFLPDTADYINTSFLHHFIPPDRSIFYSFLLSFSRIFSNSLWMPIILQSILTCYLLWLLLQKEITGSALTASSKIIIILILNFASNLPWLISELMPDIFTGLMGISLFIILFHWKDLTLPHRIAVSGSFIISTLVHFSHWAIGIALLFVWIPLLASHQRFHKNLIAAASILCSCFLIILLTNHYFSGRFLSFPTGQIFITARMIDDGIIPKLLAEHCADNHYSLCSYSPELQKGGSYYLWNDNSSMHQLGGWYTPTSDSYKLITDAIRYYPYANFQAIIVNTTHQYIMFNTGSFLEWSKNNKTAIDYLNTSIQTHYPKQFHQYATSLELNGRLTSFLYKIRPIHTVIGIMALFTTLLTGLFFLFFKQRDILSNFPGISFLLFSLSFYFLNGFILVTLSGAFHRNEARAAWLILLALCIFLFNLIGRKEHESIKN